VEEILNLVDKEIIRSGYKELLASGVVLTGGTALLEGIVETAERILNLPVRVGYPNTVGGLSEIVKSPIYATAVGLILYGRSYESDSKRNGNKNRLAKISQSMKNWFDEVF
jgi:cell division protein FtsA